MAKKPNRLTKALLETSKDMLEGGIIDLKAYEDITISLIDKPKKEDESLLRSAQNSDYKAR